MFERGKIETLCTVVFEPITHDSVIRCYWLLQFKYKVCLVWFDGYVLSWYSCQPFESKKQPTITISPNNITTSSIEKCMRNNKLITKGKVL